MSPSGIADNADAVCFGVYITVPDDPDLLTSAGRGDRCGPAHGPFGLQQVGTSWYRLPAGKMLPTAPSEPDHCGTEATGWLSGWPAAADGQPDSTYAIHADGSLPPPVGAAPAAGTVCFDSGGQLGGANHCLHSTQIRAVSCGPFDLYELPPAPGTGYCSGYCLA